MKEGTLVATLTLLLIACLVGHCIGYSRSVDQTAVIERSLDWCSHVDSRECVNINDTYTYTEE